jgi:hypothetical protein
MNGSAVAAPAAEVAAAPLVLTLESIAVPMLTSARS